MKIRIMLKDPDGIHEAVEDTIRESLKAHEELDNDEKAAIMETRSEKTWAILGKFIEYKEYITVEFDTDTNTARVVPVKELYVT